MKLRDSFGPCTTDPAAPDQLTIPLNKWPWGKLKYYIPPQNAEILSLFLQVYAILGVISLCQEYNEAPEEDGIHFEMGPVSKFNVHNGNFMEKNPLGDLN